MAARRGLGVGKMRLQAGRHDFTLFLAAAAVLAAVLALAREIVYGPGLFSDSMNHLTTARNALAGEGFVNGVGMPHSWALGYAFVLAAVGRVSGFDPTAIAGPLNALIFGLTVFVAGRYLRRRATRFAAAWGCAALALAPPLAEEASWALSETLYILLSAMALIAADRFLTAGGARLPIFLTAGGARLPIAAAAWTALAWQTRYMGVALPAAAGLAMLFPLGAQRRKTPARRLRDAAVVGAVAGAPMALLLLRNILSMGWITGVRNGPNCPLPKALADIGGIMGEWAGQSAGAGGAAAALAVALGAAGLRFARRSAVGAGGGTCGAAGGGQLSCGSAALWLWGGYAAAYVVLLAGAMRWGNVHHTVEPRYMAPVYLPLIVVGAFAFDWLRRRGRLAAVAAAAGFCLWTAGQAAPQARAIARACAGEFLQINYAGPRWADSDAAAHIRENPLEGVVISTGHRVFLSWINRAEAEYEDLNSGAPAAARREYEKAKSVSAAAGQDLLEARLAAAPEGAWVVWFNDEAAGDEARNRDLGYGAPWLRASPSLETVLEGNDGGIWRVSRRRPRPAESGELRAEIGRAPDAAAAASGGGFDIYWRGRELVYVKEGCAAEDARTRFFLHVYPRNRADLPIGRREEHKFDNLDFFFVEHGFVSAGDRCMAAAPLPEYAIERIETGAAPGAAPDGAAGVRGWGAALRAAGIRD